MVAGARCGAANGITMARQLGDALEVSPDTLFERIASHPDKQFLWVKRRITDAEVERVDDGDGGMRVHRRVELVGIGEVLRAEA